MELLSRVKEIQETLSNLNTKTLSNKIIINDASEELITTLSGPRLEAAEELIAVLSGPNRNDTIYTLDQLETVITQRTDLPVTAVHRDVIEEITRNDNGNYSISMTTNPWRSLGTQDEMRYLSPTPSEEVRITSRTSEYSNADIVATFNGRQIGRLESITYTVERDR